MLWACSRTVLRFAMVTLVLILVACGGESDGDPPPATVRPTLPPATPLPQTPMVSATLDADGDGLLNFNEYEQAVALAVDELQWPDTYQIAAGTIIDRFTGGVSAEGDGFEVGLEYSMVGIYHTCAWNMTWLDARRTGDTVREAEALDVLINILPNIPAIHPTAREQFTGIAEAASLGDPSLAQQHVTANNCADLPWAHDAEDDGSPAAQYREDHDRADTAAITWSIDS